MLNRQYLEIGMKHLLAVQVLQGLTDLHHYSSDLVFRETGVLLPGLLDQTVEGLGREIVGQDAETLLFQEGPVVGEQVGVFQGQVCLHLD